MEEMVTLTTEMAGVGKAPKTIFRLETRGRGSALVKRRRVCTGTEFLKAGISARGKDEIGWPAGERVIIDPIL
jgi:hypothetical protein